jgi:hypothetical protein
MRSYKSNQGMKSEEKIEGGSFLLAEKNFGVKTGVANAIGSDLRS